MLDLSVIRVLFRDPNMSLWGLPYELREGQAPLDLWRSRSFPVLGGNLGQMRVSPGPREGWFWLGSPGWWGSYSAEQVGACKRFLSAYDLPTYPMEWGRTEDLQKVLTRPDSAV